LKPQPTTIAPIAGIPVNCKMESAVQSKMVISFFILHPSSFILDLASFILDLASFILSTTPFAPSGLKQEIRP